MAAKVMIALKVEIGREPGGTEIDLYRFDADYGEDIIFGFYADDILLTNEFNGPGVKVIN